MNVNDVINKYQANDVAKDRAWSVCNWIFRYSAKNILEVGYQAGYLTRCMATATTGQVTAIDTDIVDNDFEKYGNIRPITSSSELAVNLFADHTFDFIFIDADHAEALKDAQLYLPKLKIGGWMLFDDL